MDKDSKLIYESYVNSSKIELIKFDRRVGKSFYNDHFNLLHKKYNKVLDVYQLYTNKNKELISTSIFDETYEDEDMPGDGSRSSMIFHSLRSFNYIDRDTVIDSIDLLRRHPFYQDNKLGVDIIFDVLKFVFGFSEKERNLKARNLKPDTESHFGDVLIGIDESVKYDLTNRLALERTPNEDDAYVDLFTYNGKSNTIYVYQLVMIDEDEHGGDRLEETEIYLKDDKAVSKYKGGLMGPDKGARYLFSFYGTDPAQEFRIQSTYLQRAFRNVENLYEDFKSAIELIDKYPVKKRDLLISLKGKTREHFGDILVGLD